MAPLTKHQSTQTTKLLLIGDSGAGKSGSLACLAAEGYKLRILDFDNGLDILKSYLTDESSPYCKKNPQCAENVSFKTLSDTMQNLNGKLAPKKATAWPSAISMLMHWKDGDEDLGKVVDWGPDTVLVLDSLSMASTAALNYHLFLNAALGKTRTQNEARRDIGGAQNLLRDLLTMLYDESIRCNVIVTSHVTMVTEAGGAPKVEEGKFDQVPTGYPSAIGRALSPHIPRFFNNMLTIRTIGSGASAKHKIFTAAQNLGNVVLAGKSSAPLKVKDSYDIAWGLAEFFKDVKGAQ